MRRSHCSSARDIFDDDCSASACCPCCDELELPAEDWLAPCPLLWLLDCPDDDAPCLPPAELCCEVDELAPDDCALLPLWLSLDFELPDLPSL